MSSTIYAVQSHFWRLTHFDNAKDLNSHFHLQQRNVFTFRKIETGESQSFFPQREPKEQEGINFDFETLEPTSDSLVSLSDRKKA